MESYHKKDELKYLNENYSFNNALHVPLILNQIFQFLDKDKAKCLSLCDKDIYQKYCKQVEKLKIKEEAEKPNLKALIDKYDNINNLDLSCCRNIKELNLGKCVNIKDFTIIFKLERLELLIINFIDIPDISFLEYNKNIKELYLNFCNYIKDFTIISKLEKL